MARCSSCQAAIRWVITHTGSTMPVDYEPSATGNLVLAKDTSGKLKSAPYVQAEHAGRRRWVSHFATCAHAKAHRRAP